MTKAHIHAQTQLVHLITGNDLMTGDVIYLHKIKGFVKNISQASYWADGEDAARQLSLVEAAQDKITGLYLMKAKDNGEHIAPLTLKEKIRAYGPTVS